MGNYTEADQIRVFLGCVSPSAEQSDVQSFLAHYGWQELPINIIAEKGTGEKKGCCFVTFQCKKDAERAIEQLNGTVTYPGMNRTLVMKIANCDNDKLDWRVFVARIPKEIEDDELKEYFIPFGNIETCIILRDTNKLSRGVAFVQYDKRSEALNCVQNAQNIIPPGVKNPMIVKMAESPQEKEVRKQTLLSREKPNAPPPPAPHVYPPPPYYGAPPTYPPTYPGQSPYPYPTQPTQPQPYPTTYPPTYPTTYPTSASTIATSPLPSSSTLDPSAYPVPPTTTPAAATSAVAAPSGAMPAMPAMPAVPTMPPPPPIPSSVAGAPHLQPGGGGGGGGGLDHTPANCAVFIYHLPPHWGENDLYQNFAYFGPIKTTKVVRDATTGQSKGFGFVNYELNEHAQQAINAMNGFQVGNLRLSVSLKSEQKNRRAAPY